MTIEVVDYNPAWRRWFERLAARIRPRVARLAKSIEHVGSTSVEGLAAKPIVDMDIIIENRANLPALIKELEALEYFHRGDLGVEGREAFGCVNPPHPHHLYVCIEGCIALRNHLLLRDHLSAHPEDREAYARLKQRLAIEHPEDIDAYIAGKTDFILGILRRHLSESALDSIESTNRPKGSE